MLLSSSDANDLLNTTNDWDIWEEKQLKTDKGQILSYSNCEGLCNRLQFMNKLVLLASVALILRKEKILKIRHCAF